MSHTSHYVLTPAAVGGRAQLAWNVLRFGPQKVDPESRASAFSGFIDAITIYVGGRTYHGRDIDPTPAAAEVNAGDPIESLVRDMRSAFTTGQPLPAEWASTEQTEMTLF